MPPVGITCKAHQSVMLFEECTHGALYRFVERHGAVTDLQLHKFLMLQVLSAVSDLHTCANLAHLDINLQNILVGEDGRLKLCDFGVARPTNDEIRERLGSDAWMAPEVFDIQQNGHFRGVPADVFSLGVLLFTLYFGQPPFNNAG